MTVQDFLRRYRPYVLLVAGCLGLGLVGVIWWTSSTRGIEPAPLPLNDPTKVAASSATSTSTAKTAASVARPKEITIDVKGSVYRPGVYRFSSVPIVETVIKRAGGCRPEVNLTRINLAATLSDGQVLFVPNGEEEVPENYPLPGQPNATSSETGGGQIAGTALINLNVATVSDLTTLPGIGEKRAQDILQHRDSNGGFKTVTDLKDVSGIGEKTFEKLAPLVTVG